MNTPTTPTPEGAAREGGTPAPKLNKIGRRVASGYKKDSSEAAYRWLVLHRGPHSIGEVAEGIGMPHERAGTACAHLVEIGVAHRVGSGVYQATYMRPSDATDRRGERLIRKTFPTAFGPVDPAPVSAPQVVVQRADPIPYVEPELPLPTPQVLTPCGPDDVECMLDMIFPNGVPTGKVLAAAEWVELTRKLIAP